MLGSAQIPDPQAIGVLRDDVGAFDGDLLDRSAVADLGARLVNNIDVDGRYVDAHDRIDATEFAQVSFSPALILRKRSKQGLVDVYGRILDQMRERGVVPAGVRRLLDPSTEATIPAELRPAEWCTNPAAR